MLGCIFYQIPFFKNEDYFSSIDSYTAFIKGCERLVRQNDRYSKYINYFISEIKNFKENEKEYEKEGEIKAKKYIFTINIKRELNLKNKSKKVTTVLITDDKIKQLFIDNINGTNYSIEDIESIDIKTFINLEENKKIISEELINFFRENKRELGKKMMKFKNKL